MWIPNCSGIISWKDSFPIELFWHPCWKSLDHNIRVYFWSLNSIPLIYMPIIPVPNCLDYSTCVITFEIGNYESSIFVFPFQKCSSCSGSLAFPCEFEDQLSNFCKKKLVFNGKSNPNFSDKIYFWCTSEEIIRISKLCVNQGWSSWLRLKQHRKNFKANNFQIIT